MFSLTGQASGPTCSPSPSRREFLRVGGLTLGGLALPTLLAKAATKRATAKSCILIFMDGGPSHLETFDMKPNAPVEVRGEFQPIRSSVPGTTVCELLPKLSQQMHHFAQVRSVHHGINDHNAGSYYLLTGRSPSDGGRLVLTDSAMTFPCYGSVLAKLKPSQAMPPYVLLPEYQWNNGVDIGGQKGGFLGPRFDAFISGDPSLPKYRVPGFDSLPELPLDRLSRRDDLRQELDRAIGRLGETPNSNLDIFQQQARELIVSPRTRQAFDLSRETPAVRNRYGMDPGSDRSLEARKFGGLPHLGQCLLLSRRLIEAGVRLVTVMTGRRIDQAWDTHRDHFGLMRKSLCPPFDQALATLMADLKERGLLQETLVVVMGEFGRTPKVGQITSNAGANKNNGRDHWPYCFTVLLAGGGIPGGAVYGASDSIAAFPKANPTSPEDIAATIYTTLGIDPTLELRDGQNRPYALSSGTAIPEFVS